MTPAEALEHVWLGRIPYRDTWALQRRLAELRSRDEIDDVVVLVEHPAVYTMGRNGSPDHLPFGIDHLTGRGAEYVEVDRGGSVTFHGPGQLVAYPIVLIARAFPFRGHPGLGDVIAHLRALEEAMITTVAACGVQARRRPPYTGIWVGGQKLAAIGVKLAGGVTTHGAALNVSTDLDWFSQVIPCGIEGAGVASLQSLGVEPLPEVSVLGERLVADLAALMGREPRPASTRVQAEVAATVAAAVGRDGAKPVVASSA
ncbi:MAG: lipoyl(octanoyl) transferase LipB [Candidatus Dormibacteraeota bacterium]|nr:lipoyl(octanoyl) transferase LipB [Candidatus Dormibacteraeota bacterium]